MAQIIIFLIAWPHEVCHYLAARSLGLKAYIESGVTQVQRGAKWKDIVVTLAPALVGVMLSPLPLWWYFHASRLGDKLVACLLSLAVLAWEVGCYYDFKSVFSGVGRRK